MLKPQFINLANSSFLLYLDNLILSKGSGLQTVSSYFYPVGQQFGKYIYAAPYQPIIANENISGNITPTGIYVSGTLVNRNTSNFFDFNYQRGWAIFNNNVGDYTKVSGTYSVAEINVLPLNISEEKLLFETKLSLRPKTSSPAATGINQDSMTYPALYVKTPLTINNQEFAFGGMDETRINIGIFIFAESAYQKDAICGILADSAHSNIPLLTADKFPLNIYGGLKNTGTNFNYYTTSSGYIGAGSGLYIDEVTISSFNRYYNTDFSKLNPDCHWAIADFTLLKPRFPRSLRNNL